MSKIMGGRQRGRRVIWSEINGKEWTPAGRKWRKEDSMRGNDGGRGKRLDVLKTKGEGEEVLWIPVRKSLIDSRKRPRRERYIMSAGKKKQTNRKGEIETQM